MIIALLTDFGTQDYFVGAMKGVMLSINQNVQIIDISHEIEPQNIKSAQFILSSVYQNFPPKTIFLAVVDPGVGSNRRAILVETENYFFVAPDNGLLEFIFQSEQNFRVFELTNPKYFLPNVSRTFHGRDIFSPVAAWIANGIEPTEFGAEIKEFIRLADNKNEPKIIHIDRFGNLITNLKRENLPHKFLIEVNGNLITKHLNFYAEAEKDEIFTIFGSADYLEIVAFQNSAKDLLNIKTGEKIVVKIT